MHRLSAQHQSDNQQTALADCLADVDAVISIYPIGRETCNPDGVGFRQIVEIRRDPDRISFHPQYTVTFIKFVDFDFDTKAEPMPHI